MATPTPRVRMPATAKKGEIIEVKTLISHDMESGQRKDAEGKIVPQRYQALTRTERHEELIRFAQK